MNLRDVEYREGSGKHSASTVTVIVGFLVFVIGQCHLFPEHDRGRLLALAHLGACGQPLAISSPQALVVAGPHGCDPQGDGVYSSVPLPRSDIGWPGCRSTVVVPGHEPLAGADLDGGDDLRGDAGVHVGAIRWSVTLGHWEGSPRRAIGRLSRTPNPSRRLSLSSNSGARLSSPAADGWKPTRTCTKAFPQSRISGCGRARKAPGWRSGRCLSVRGARATGRSHEKRAYGRSRLSEDHSPAARPVKMAAAGASA